MPFTHARRALSLGGRWTAVDGTVIVGTKPSALLGDPRRLAAMGVTGVVNLCAEFRGPVAAYRRLAIEHLRLPTSDHVEPAAEVLDAAVAFIRKHERAGGRVYVHCCAKIKILRRVRAESSRRPPRHRCDTCSMAWRCRFLAARPSQIGRVIAEK